MKKMVSHRCNHWKRQRMRTLLAHYERTTQTGSHAIRSVSVLMSNKLESVLVLFCTPRTHCHSPFLNKQLNHRTFNRPHPKWSADILENSELQWLHPARWKQEGFVEIEIERIENGRQGHGMNIQQTCAFTSALLGISDQTVSSKNEVFSAFWSPTTQIKRKFDIIDPFPNDSLS